MSGEARHFRSRNKRKNDGNSSSPTGNGHPRKSSKGSAVKLVDDSDLVLWKSPWLVVKYSTLEAGHYLLDWCRWLIHHKLTLIFLCLVVGKINQIKFIVNHTDPTFH